jgi:predicted O-methyltransferase YrrM
MNVMFSKINFLIKNKTSPLIIFLFLLQKIKNIPIKKKILRQKRANQLNLKNYKISSDWFSSHAFFFKNFMKKLPENFKYLEIGSFEGNSAIFVSSTFPKSEITCVDPWVNYEENSNTNLAYVENFFDLNTKNISNIKKIKNTSDNFFTKNKQNYDFIYIDGYHKYEYVFKDCLNSWEVLVPGGVLVCDDYIWEFYKGKEINLNPCFAINKFLEIKKENAKVLLVSSSQIFIQKLKS